LKLGGESKGAFYYPCNVDNTIRLNEKTKDNIRRSKMFKMYLATPAIFNKGWIPNFVDDDLIVSLDNNINFKIICSSIGKYKMVSGWDMSKGKPKAAYRVLPAGSVFYCKVLNNEFNLKLLLDKFHGKSISDKRVKDGFGITYIGGIKNV